MSESRRREKHALIALVKHALFKIIRFPTHLLIFSTPLQVSTRPPFHHLFFLCTKTLLRVFDFPSLSHYAPAATLNFEANPRKSFLPESVIYSKNLPLFIPIPTQNLPPRQNPRPSVWCARKLRKEKEMALALALDQSSMTGISNRSPIAGPFLKTMPFHTLRSIKWSFLCFFMMHESYVRKLIWALFGFIYLFLHVRW